MRATRRAIFGAQFSDAQAPQPPRYILNRPLDADAAPRVATLRHALRVADAAAVAHGVGGPVSLADFTILHRFGGVRGAEAVGVGDLHVGGDLLELREAAAAAVALRDGRIDGGRGGADNKPLVRVLYGHAGWAPGQLEGEIAAGAWKCARPPPATRVCPPDLSPPPAFRCVQVGDRRRRQRAGVDV